MNKEEEKAARANAKEEVRELKQKIREEKKERKALRFAGKWKHCKD